jgi:hypothetical protein
VIKRFVSLGIRKFFNFKSILDFRPFGLFEVIGGYAKVYKMFFECFREKHVENRVFLLIKKNMARNSSDWCK